MQSDKPDYKTNPIPRHFDTSGPNGPRRLQPNSGAAAVPGVVIDGNAQDAKATEARSGLPAENQAPRSRVSQLEDAAILDLINAAEPQILAHLGHKFDTAVSKLSDAEFIAIREFAIKVLKLRPRGDL